MQEMYKVKYLYNLHVKDLSKQENKAETTREIIGKF